jgi:hypothetical protein
VPEIANAQSRERPRNAIQADLGLAVIGLAYERVLTPYVGVQFEAQIFGTWFGPLFGFPNFTGYGGQVRPTFFLFGTAPEGLYLAPFLRVDQVSADAAGASGSGIGYSAGMFVGYSVLIAHHVNFRIGAGAQYVSYKIRAGTSEVQFQTLFPALDLVLGYAF